MSKIVISPSEVHSVVIPADPLEPPAKLPPAIPLWARLTVLPLVLVLPLLAVVALVVRIALRAAPPRTQQAWYSYLLALMIASSGLFLIGAVLLFSYVPAPPHAISTGMSDLDERTSFPLLPSLTRMSGVDVAQNLRSLVVIASPAQRRWLSRGDTPTGVVGAAVLLHAGSSGYLFATARHIADGASTSAGRVLLTSGLGGWVGADVIGRHKVADLALLWLPRHYGSGEFFQPLAAVKQIQPGSGVYVIGHPQGLNFTISNGMVSRLAGDTLQISAPVSPGNSGGPVYDEHGYLLGVVIAKLDRNVNPNAENLNFAAAAALCGQLSGWDFAGEGQQRLTEYIQGLQRSEVVPTSP